MKPIRRVGIFPDDSYIVFTPDGLLFRKGYASHFVEKHKGKKNGDLWLALCGTWAIMTSTDDPRFRKIWEAI